jgi:hypothetical protein
MEIVWLVPYHVQWSVDEINWIELNYTKFCSQNLPCMNKMRERYEDINWTNMAQVSALILEMFNFWVLLAHNWIDNYEIFVEVILWYIYSVYLGSVYEKRIMTVYCLNLILSTGCQMVSQMACVMKKLSTCQWCNYNKYHSDYSRKTCLKITEHNHKWTNECNSLHY